MCTTRVHSGWPARRRVRRPRLVSSLPPRPFCQPEPECGHCGACGHRHGAPASGSASECGAYARGARASSESVAREPRLNSAQPRDRPTIFNEFCLSVTSRLGLKLNPTRSRPLWLPVACPHCHCPGPQHNATSSKSPQEKTRLRRVRAVVDFVPVDLT